MDYREALEWLNSRLPMFQRIGGAAYKPGLERTEKLLKALGNPEREFKSIHIAGTNGKGSVSHMLASILQEAGYKTGLYTSPHLRDFRERIRVNGKMIPEQAVSDFITSNQNIIEETEASFFEMTAAMAFRFFADEKVDIAIAETGMGGRLDSTNVILPLVSVITNIGLDHTQFLGETPGKIAFEKAGIIKKNVPAVAGTKGAAADVFISKAREEKTTLAFADEIFSGSRIVASSLDGLSVDVILHGKPYLKNLQIGLSGSFQMENALTALAAIRQLKGFVITHRHVRDGMRKVKENTGFKGRFEVIRRNPLVIADCGHNAEGFGKTLPELKKTGFSRLHFVLGVSADKDYRAILALLPKEAEYYFCCPPVPRGLDAGKLKAESAAFGLHGSAYGSVRDAYEKAVAAAGADDLVFVSGSMFVVAEII